LSLDHLGGKVNQLQSRITKLGKVIGSQEEDLQTLAKPFLEVNTYWYSAE